MGMGDRDPSLHGVPRGCFSTENYKEQCKLRHERDICICVYCKRWSHCVYKFCIEINRISYNKENFINLTPDEKLEYYICGELIYLADLKGTH